MRSSHWLAEAARLVPKGVICLASALAFHGLTDQMPPKVWISLTDSRPLGEALCRFPQHDGQPILLMYGFQALVARARLAPAADT